MSNHRFASVWDAIEDTPEEAENMKLRSVLMTALKNHLTRTEMSQAQAAKLFGVTQPRVSDLMRGNILAHEGRLSAVIDFGGLRAGDPAGDLLPAWHVFAGEARAVFRAEAVLDDDAWARGLGWALSIELMAIAYFRERAPERTRRSRALVQAMLAEHT